MKYPRIEYMHISRSVADFDYFLRWGCEIWYLISGDVRYFVENQIYEVEPGDLIITNPNEIHKPTFKSNTIYERITLCFDPTFFSQFSTESFDLLSCFYDRKNGVGNKITLTAEEDVYIRELFSRIERARESDEASRDIQQSALVIELLILINKAVASSADEERRGSMSGLVTEVINYIGENLKDDLSLEALEKRFFVSGAHLCRSFKAETGITLHKFIVKKRISYAKILLSEGASVTHTMSASGFSDLSNFIRSFKRIVGITPSEYRRDPDIHALQAQHKVAEGSELKRKSTHPSKI